MLEFGGRVICWQASRGSDISAPVKDTVCFAPRTPWGSPAVRVYRLVAAFGGGRWASGPGPGATASDAVSGIALATPMLASLNITRPSQIKIQHQNTWVKRDTLNFGL